MVTCGPSQRVDTQALLPTGLKGKRKKGCEQGTLTSCSVHAFLVPLEHWKMRKGHVD